MNQNNKSESKLQQLKAVLEGHQTMLIVLQDNPDPDAIASAVALRKLANTLANVQCSITHGGLVGRAENRTLVKYLGLNLRPIEQLDLTQFELFAVVDTQPGTGNNSLPEEIEPDIVIDHHTCRERTRHCRFTDVRSKYGATATILYEYLQEADIELEVPLITALLYAIRSDTQDFGRDSTKADIDAHMELYPLANKRMLSQIQHGKVSRDYYQMMADALKNTHVFDNAIVTNLGQIDNADMIGEIADFLLRDDRTNWVMVFAFIPGKLMISLRTYDEELRANDVIRHIVDEIGTGGGHPSYAGGQIPTDKASKKDKSEFEALIVSRFIEQVVKGDTQQESLIQI